MVEFHQLHTRPMVKIEIASQGKQLDAIKNHIQEKLLELDQDSIVRIHLSGPNAQELHTTLSASELRALAPPTMNISLLHGWRHDDNRPNAT
jgi:hypothetical protein